MASSSSATNSKYPYPSTAVHVENFVSVKIEGGENHNIWRKQMLCLIESQDLCGFIDGEIQPPPKTVTVPYESSPDGEKEVKNPDYQLWRRSDRLIQGWILGTLDKKILHGVVSLDTAREVWLNLENKLKEDSDDKDDGTNSCPEKDYTEYLPLYRAALNGDWDSAKTYIVNQEKELKDAATTSINSHLDTALHVAVGTGKAIDFVQNLVNLMPNDSLALADDIGDAALHIAATVGNKEAAAILLDRNPELLYMTNNNGYSPIHTAAINCKRDILVYLLSVSRRDVQRRAFMGQFGVSLLISLIASEFLDLAIDLVEDHPDLAVLADEDGDYALL